MSQSQRKGTFAALVLVALFGVGLGLLAPRGRAGDQSVLQSTGGQNNAAVAAGAPGAGTVLSGQGRLCRITVTSVGSAATSFYDNASAASGTVLYTLKASPAVGDIYDVQMPCANGIYAGGTTNTSGVTLSYMKNTAGGQ